MGLSVQPWKTKECTPTVKSLSRYPEFTIFPGRAENNGESVADIKARITILHLLLEPLSRWRSEAIGRRPARTSIDDDTFGNHIWNLQIFLFGVYMLLVWIACSRFEGYDLQF